VPVGTEVSLGPGHIVLDGDTAPPSLKKGALPPATICKTVRPMLSDRCVCPVCDVGVLWPNGWMHQDETWYRGSLGPGDIVLDADPASPNFRLSHVCCGQMAGCIKIPLCTEVSLGPGDSVRWGPSCPPWKGAQFVYAVSAIFLLLV